MSVTLFTWETLEYQQEQREALMVLAKSWPASAPSQRPFGWTAG